MPQAGRQSRTQMKRTHFLARGLITSAWFVRYDIRILNFVFLFVVLLSLSGDPPHERHRTVFWGISTCNGLRSVTTITLIICHKLLKANVSRHPLLGTINKVLKKHV